MRWPDRPLISNVPSGVTEDEPLIIVIGPSRSVAAALIRMVLAVGLVPPS